MNRKLFNLNLDNITIQTSIAILKQLHKYDVYKAERAKIRAILHWFKDLVTKDLSIF